MKKQYLIRLDDACPTMSHANWEKIECILDKYGIKPMVGVVPCNEDTKLMIDPEDSNFWELVHKWENKSWTIALHGYNHVYSTQEGGINPLWNKSEFAGNSEELQREKIRNGVAVLHEHGINPKYFFAPSHTFDETTIIALRQESDIRVISDTIAIRPYKKNGFIYIPQWGGQCREMKFCGLYTFCLHPSMMDENNFAYTENFIKNNYRKFTSFDKLDLNNVRSKTLFDKLLSFAYFKYRCIKKK